MPLLKPTENENLNFIKKKKRRSCKRGPRSSFQSAGADPPLLKRYGGGGGGRGYEEGGGVGGGRRKVGVGVVGLWTFKMVYLVPTQYFLIQLQLISHLLILIVQLNEKKG